MTTTPFEPIRESRRAKVVVLQPARCIDVSRDHAIIVLAGSFDY
jgi:hypothetical protein